MKISLQVGNDLREVTIARSDGQYRVTVDGTEHVVDARKLESDFYSLVVDGRSYEVSVESDGSSYYVRHGAVEQVITLADPGRRARQLRAGGEGPEKVVAMMPGRVVRLLVSDGDTVARGQGLAVVEAMKMENEIPAPKSGRISSINVESGRTVEAGETLMVIE